jgi:hypothetical protein
MALDINMDLGPPIICPYHGSASYVDYVGGIDWLLLLKLTEVLICSRIAKVC